MPLIDYSSMLVKHMGRRSIVLVEINTFLENSITQSLLREQVISNTKLT